jgi:hypothetical protein
METRIVLGATSFTVYLIRSDIYALRSQASSGSGVQDHRFLFSVTAERRFKEFMALRTDLCSDFPFALIPPLPEKTHRNTKENPAAVLKRSRHLSLWLQYLSLNPLLLQFSSRFLRFLSGGNENLAGFLGFRGGISPLPHFTLREMWDSRVRFVLPEVVGGRSTLKATIDYPEPTAIKNSSSTSDALQVDETDPPALQRYYALQAGSVQYQSKANETLISGSRACLLAQVISRSNRNLER